jgi:hypothetical protein
LLCDLHDAGLNHIWGFYIRNQSRPTWLARTENRVDALIGNPPWLAFRFMPQAMQAVFERRARERHLWLGGARGRTTQHDLSAFFVARAVELYLRVGGRFGFVMPRAVLSRQTYRGFRAADYSGAGEECYAAFNTAWDLWDVEPEPFPVPSAVVFGTRARRPVVLSETVLAWTGEAPDHGTEGGSLASATARVAAVTGEEEASVYKDRFRAGAIPLPADADHGRRRSGDAHRAAPRSAGGLLAEVGTRQEALERSAWPRWGGRRHLHPPRLPRRVGRAVSVVLAGERGHPLRRNPAHGRRR